MVAIFSRGNDPMQGHVGLVISTIGDYVDILGGNQSGAVRITQYRISLLLGLRWF